jgi:hypothetical protein
VSQVLNVREFVFPTSFTVSSTNFLIEGANAQTVPVTAMCAVDPITVTMTPYDTVAAGTVALSHNTTATPTGATASSTTTLDPSGAGAMSLKIIIGQGTRYLFARVTAPGGAYRDIACATPVSTTISPLWPSTSNSLSGCISEFGGPDYGAWFFGTAAYWDWATKMFDTNMVDILPGVTGIPNTQGRIKSGFFSTNMVYGYVNIVHTLVNTSQTGSQLSAGDDTAWWIRWGFKRPIVVKRYTMGRSYPGYPTDPNITYVLTGYSDISFTSGTTLVSLPGSSVPYLAGNYWVNIANPQAFTHYEMRCTQPYQTRSNIFMILGN